MSALRIYNTQSGALEEFIPQDPPKVRMYVCGVTSYDVCHLGHARTAVNFDLIVRYLRFKHYKVFYVRNITDIDDKIIRRALEEKLSARQISEKYIKKMRADYARLRLLSPDSEPRATKHIDEIIAFVSGLIQKNYAYQTTGGDVCFRVREFKEYGCLSRKKTDELLQGVRVEVDATKEDPADFVLWKASKPGEPAWPSPWGDGRPGWHIECSAMVRKELGDTPDIHGGGSDLIFPHHENEIAQSAALTGKPLARYWVHCAPLTVGGQKMSKSLNNFVTISDLLDEYHPEVLRYFLILGHYRSPLDWNHKAMRQAVTSLNRLYIALKEFSPEVLTQQQPATQPTAERDFFRAMDDDFNTPRALAALFALANESQKKSTTKTRGCRRAIFAKMRQNTGICFVKNLRELLARKSGRKTRKSPKRWNP